MNNVQEREIDKRISQLIPEEAQFGTYNVKFDGVVIAGHRSLEGALEVLQAVCESRYPHYPVSHFCWDQETEYFYYPDEPAAERTFATPCAYIHPVLIDRSNPPIDEQFIYGDIDLWAILLPPEHAR